MAVNIETRDGKVSIKADDGSVVRGIRIGTRYIVDRKGNAWPSDLHGRPGFFDRPTGRLLVFGGILLFCLAFWFGVIALFSHEAHGADCSVLHDADERHMCRALSENLKSECEFIKNPDLRNECRIRLENRKPR